MNQVTQPALLDEIGAEAGHLAALLLAEGATCSTDAGPDGLTITIGLPLSDVGLETGYRLLRGAAREAFRKRGGLQ